MPELDIDFRKSSNFQIGLSQGLLIVLIQIRNRLEKQFTTTRWQKVGVKAALFMFGYLVL